MFDYLAYYNLKNYSLEEINKEKNELLFELNTLNYEKNKIKKIYIYSKIFNFGICIFYLLILSATVLFPQLILGFNTIFSNILSIIMLYTCFYLFQHSTNLFKNEDVIKEYNEINKHITENKEKIDKLNEYLKTYHNR